VLSASSEIQAIPARIAAITFASPERAKFYLQETPYPFPVLSDPTLSAYRAFGLDRARWTTMLRPGVIGRYLKAMLRGWMPKKPHKGDDLLQLGGDFILDAAGILRYAHPSAEPTDRPSAAALLAALRAAA